MEKKFNTKALTAFMKRNKYYILMAVCVVVMVTLITVSVVLINNRSIAPPVIEKPSEELPVEKVPEDKPIIKDELVFTFPVLGGGEIGVGYDLTSPVFNQTLEHFAIHNGVDIKGAMGTGVVSALDGVVESVSGANHTDGYSVVISSNKGVKCTYSSLGNDVKVSVGDKVVKGQVIGTMSDTFDKEYLDGVHLHFAVQIDGRYVDPGIYIMADDK